MASDLVLVDTSAWIFALRRPAVPEIRRRLDRLLADDRVAITPIVRLEILGGVSDELQFRRLRLRLAALWRLDVYLETWSRAEDLAFRLRRRGLSVPYTDLLIAVVALGARATVLHADRHFDRLAALAGLRVESYVRVVPSGGRTG